jgi:hypothetical protein
VDGEENARARVILEGRISQSSGGWSATAQPNTADGSGRNMIGLKI